MAKYRRDFRYSYVSDYASLLVMKKTDYDYIVVESFYSTDTAGRHGPIHIRPLPGPKPYETYMFVACSEVLTTDYPVGAKFRIRAKITNLQRGTPYIYSHYSWNYDVIKD